MENTLERLGRPAPRVGAGLAAPADPRRGGRRRPGRRRRRQLRRRVRRPGRRARASRASRTPRVHRRPGAVGRGPAAPCGWSPAEIDSLDPQRSYLPGVWNLMRLYTRTLVTYSTEPGAHRRAGARPRHRPGHRVGGRPELDVHAPRGRPVRERPADHLAATSSTASSGRSPPTSSSAGPRTSSTCSTTRPTPTPGPYQDETADRLGLASIETPDDRTIIFPLRAPQPDFPFVMALPSSSPVPIEADTGADYGSDPVSSGPYAITSVDPATGILLDRNPQWDPATDDGPHRAARPGRRPHRAERGGARPGAAGRVGRHRHVRHRRAGRHDRPARRPTRTHPVRDRVDDVTTGAIRLLALPTDVRADGQRRLPGRGGRGRRPARPCRTTLGGAVERGAPLAAVAARRSTAARRTPIPAPTSTPPGRRWRRAGSRTASAPCWPWPTRRAASTSPRRSPGSSPRSASRSRSGRSSATTFYATDVGNPDNVAANGYGIVLATWTADFPTPGVVPGAAGRRPQHPRGRQHQLRAARPTRRSTRWSTRRARAGATAAAWREVAGAVGGDVGVRAAGRDPGAAGRRAAVAQRRGDAAVQRLRPRHRRRPLSGSEPSERPRASVRLDSREPGARRRSTSLEKS